MARPAHTPSLVLMSLLACCSSRPAANTPAASPPPAASLTELPTAAPPASAEETTAPPGRAVPIAEAYARKARGDDAGARAAFGEVIAAMVALGEQKKPGLGGAKGSVVRGRSLAGVTLGGASWYFDPDSGEPQWFDALALVRWATPARSPFFVVSAVSQNTLYDPAAREPVELPGRLIAMHPDGMRAYLLDNTCSLREFHLGERRLGRSFSRPAPPGDPAAVLDCDPYALRDAVISRDQLHLITRWGRWDLKSGAYQPLPFPHDDRGLSMAISPDGRYAARMAIAAGAPELRLYDFESGRERRAPLITTSISNNDPLSFALNPARVCVFDYAFWIFEVPSLRLVSKQGLEGLASQGVDPGRCETTVKDDHPELLARLASRVCSIGGLLVPARYC